MEDKETLIEQLRDDTYYGQAVEDEAADEIERLREFGEKVNAIRNSIIGTQTIDWSEHIYPLVAALNEAGFDGQEYPEAKANIGTLLERNEQLRTVGNQLRDAIANYPMSDEEGLAAVSSAIEVWDAALEGK